MLHQKFSTRLPEVIDLLKKNKVSRAYAFGSVCSPAFTDDSDIDLLISFEEGLDPAEYGKHYWDLLFSLQTLFGREIDLVTERSLKNPYLIESINKNKNIIYGRAA